MPLRFQSYFYCEACNLPLIKLKVFKETYFVSESQVRRLLREKVIFGKMFRSRMYIALNPSISNIQDYL